VGKSLRIEGFLVRDHTDAREEFERFITPRVQSGEIPLDETVTDGFEHVVDAFTGMLRGANTGKALVRLDGN
jgi:NADPH-dependent curcumin reductase CurA